jgi:flagellar biosynthetic protein FliO
MDEIRQVLAVLTVLGMLGGALWWLRRRGYAQFAGKPRSGAKGRNMRVIERLPLTPQHSLHLVRVADRTIIVAASPGGCSILDSVAIPGDEGISL